MGDTTALPHSTCHSIVVYTAETLHRTCPASEELNIIQTGLAYYNAPSPPLHLWFTFSQAWPGHSTANEAKTGTTPVPVTLSVSHTAEV